MSGRLGELLVRENLISLQQLQKAQEEQRKTGGRIGSALDQARARSRSRLTTSSRSSTASRRSTSRTSTSTRTSSSSSRRTSAEKHQVIPVNRAGPSLIVAMSDPSNIYAIDDLKFLTGYNVEAVVASEQAIKEAIERTTRRRARTLDEMMARLRRRRGRGRRGRGDDERRRPREERRRTRRSSSS